MIPKVVLYNSVSLDGRLNGFETDIVIYDKIESQSDYDAVLMDPDTFENRFHNSSEKIKAKDRKKLHVIPDSEGRIKWSDIDKNENLNKNILVLCTRSTSQVYLNILEDRYINYMVIGFEDVNFATALEELNTQFGVKTLHVRSDGSLNGKLLRDDLVEEINVLIHPVMVGGESPDSIFIASDLKPDTEILDLRLLEMKSLGHELIFLRYRVMKYKF